MKQVKKIPSINIPIQKADGSLEWVWYMFLQWLSENLITTGEENGTIAVNGTDVPVKGLGTAAYQSDDDYVHKAGTETITGEKRFAAPVFRKLTSYAYTEMPSEQVWCSYYASDKNNETWAACDFVKGTSGQNVVGFAVKGADGTWCDTGLGIGVTLTGETYTYAPIPSATNSTSNKQIATCGWVNDYTLSTGIVHKDGTETVSGYKFFSGGLSRKMTSYAYTETPTDIVYNGIYATDKNNESWASCNFAKGTGGQNVAGLSVKGVNGDWCDTGLGIGVTLTGETYTYAPIPSATNSTSNKQIATCGWVNDYTLSTGIVHKDGNETIAGQKTFTDTPIIKKATGATLDCVDTNDLTSTDGSCTINAFHNTNTKIGNIDFYRRGTLSQSETHTYAGTADLVVIKPDNSDGYIGGSADVLSSLAHMAMPNYGAGIISTTGTAATNGFLYAKNQGSPGCYDAILTLKSGSTTLFTLRLIWFESIMIPVPKGISWAITEGYVPYACFYPCYGG